MKRVTFGLVLILNLMLAAQVAFAQQQEMEEYTFEVGGQLTLVNLSSLKSIATTPIGTIRFQEFDRSYGGIGARFGYNFNRYLTFEAEWNYIPKRNFSEGEQSRKAQFLAGVKAGVREESFGIFAKARPGVMYFSTIPSQTTCTFGSLQDFSCTELSQTNFALDMGGVFEYYPSTRAIIRIDAGDTLVRFKEAGPTETFNSSFFIPAATTHNFQLSLGFSYRF